jgi:hypothetical protein
MDPRSALAAAAWLIACSAGGVALGGYTIGGFDFGTHIQAAEDDPQPLTAVDRTDLDATSPVLAPAAAYHVCTGCDAHPYRDGAWTQHYVSYDEDASAEPPMPVDDDNDDTVGTELAPSVALSDGAGVWSPRPNPAGT